jgi:integrase
MLYLVSVYTDLPASELASLTPESFDLGDRPTVTVLAAYSKRRRENVLPLHPDVVRRFRPWLADRRPGERL